MAIAIKKDSSTNVLEEVGLGPTYSDAKSSLVSVAAFTALPVPTLSVSTGTAPTASAVHVNSEGRIRYIAFSDTGSGFYTGDILTVTQGDVSGTYTFQSSDFTTALITPMTGLSIVGYSSGSGKTVVEFPTATWNALTTKPEPDGGWTVADDFTVALVEKTDLEKLKDEARGLHAWLDSQSYDIEKYGHYYTDDARKALHDGEAQAHRGAHIVLLRNAPSVASLTVAERREWIKYMQKGFSDAANIKAAYPRVVLAGVARQLAGLTPVVRFPSAPLTWVDPRTDPPTQVSVANVIDFSSNTGFGSTTGLNLLSTQASFTADYSEGDWIDDILGDVPAKIFNLTATPSTLNHGSVALTWTLPADTGSALTSIEAQHHDIDSSATIDTLVATATSHVYTSLSAGKHTFRVRAKNANGSAPWATVSATVPEAD